MVIIIGIILQIIAAVATIVGGVTAIKNKKLGSSGITVGVNHPQAQCLC